MVPYYGDFAEDDTVNIPFNTFSSDDPSASVTITDLADADINVHKDGSITQATTDGATVVINFDGITGNHMITIDTSVDAYYATGSEYSVRIEGTTVDGATINAWVGSFSIERAGGVLALVKLITAAGPTKTEMDTAHALLATEAKQDIIDTNVDQIETAVITNAAGTDISADVAAVKVDTAATLVDTAEIGTAGAGLTDLGGMSTGMKAEVNAEADTALSDYDPPTKAEMDTGHGLLATEAKQDIIDTNVDQIEAATVGTISELSQGAPSATPTLKEAVMLPYMKVRNKSTVTATQDSVYNDADTVIAKSTLSDDGTTFTKDEMVSGP